MTVEEDRPQDDRVEVSGEDIGAERAREFGRDVLGQTDAVAEDIALPKIPVGLLQDPDFMEALSSRDVRGIFRGLQVAGVSQRQIGRLTGQAQSEISEIIGGRMVANYDLLCRIADGLGIPRDWMGLGQKMPTPEQIEDLIARAEAFEAQQRALGREALGSVRLVRRRRTAERPVIVLPNDTWTGDLTRQLRIASRLSVREFAAAVGVSDRMVSKWEAAGNSLTPQMDNQRSLDRLLTHATLEVRRRFAYALRQIKSAP